MPVSTQGGVVASGARRPAGRRRLPQYWPLALLVLGYPLWWLVGVSSVMPILVAAPMLVQLVRGRRLSLPRGTGIWLLFLVWVVASVFTLYAYAPGSVGEAEPSRLLVYGFRLLWYLACTVVLIWIANMGSDKLPSRRAMSLVGFMFVISVAGGLLGVLWPTLDFPSLVEMILPKGIGNNAFVHELVHPGVADVQTVLGHPEARPKAPFSYANTWGANISLGLLFFVAAWFRSGARWHRAGGMVILFLALIPIVYSLNRGLWAALLLGCALIVFKQLLSGRLVAIIATCLTLLVVIGLFVASPLANTVSSRMDHQHSNERRFELATATVESVAKGSPVVGFGSTRDIQGSFTSIAGGSTPECPACGVPALGTQGHLWLVLFSQGFGGAILYLVFLSCALARSWRCRTPVETVCTCALLFTFLEMFVYGLLGMPLFLLMLAIGLVSREQRENAREGSSALQRLQQRAGVRVKRVVRFIPAISVLVVLGAIGGAAWAATSTQMYEAKVSILLAPSPTYLAAQLVGDTSSAEPKAITIDTEAALVESERTLAGARESAPSQASDLRDSISISAPPNTRILTLGVEAASPSGASSAVEGVAHAYLQNRRDYLDDRRQQVLEGLRKRSNELSDSSGVGVVDSVALNLRELESVRALESERVQQAIVDLQTQSTEPGEIVARSEPYSVPRRYAVKSTSGALIGLVVAVLLCCGVRSNKKREPGRVRVERTRVRWEGNRQW